MNAPNPEGVTPFLIESADVNGGVVCLPALWQQLIAPRTYPPAIVAALGALAAFAALLAARVKTPTRITLQAQGNGPVPLWVVDLSAERELRAMAQRKEPALPLADNAPFAELLGEGQLALILELPATRIPYTSLVPYQGQTLAAALEAFLAQSDQRDSRLWLAADATAVGGLLLQRLPSALPHDPDGWRRVTLLVDTVQQEELLTCPAPQLLQRLFAEERVRVFEPVAIHAFRRHEPARIAALLRLLGRVEIEQLADESGMIEIHDELSGHTYRLHREEALAALAADAVSPARLQ